MNIQQKNHPLSTDTTETTIRVYLFIITIIIIIIIIIIILIGVAPIKQYMHVPNTIVTLQGAHLMW